MYIDMNEETASGSVLYQVRHETGSKLCLERTEAGTIRIETSDDQVVVVDHTPYYAKGTAIVFKGADDDAPTVDITLTQVAYRFTGSEQGQPTAEHADAVRQQLVSIIAELVANRPNDRGLVLGEVEGEMAFLHAAQQYFDECFEKTEARRQAACVHHDGLQRALRDAYNDVVAKTAAWREAQHQKVLAYDLSTIDDTLICRVVHGNLAKHTPEDPCGQTHTVADFIRHLHPGDAVHLAS